MAGVDLSMALPYSLPLLLARVRSCIAGNENHGKTGSFLGTLRVLARTAGQPPPLPSSQIIPEQTMGVRLRRWNSKFPL